MGEDVQRTVYPLQNGGLLYTVDVYSMLRTQVYLTQKETQALRLLAAQSGKSQSELIREAIDLLVHTRGSQDRTALIAQARGLWKNRKDLPDFSALRREWDRGR